MVSETFGNLSTCTCQEKERNNDFSN